jgi:NAD(P)-dependent dehydrogenase (short-subunit alcohol dehydrogenase family)
VENGCNVLIADLALRPEAQVLADRHQNGPGRIVFQETNVTDWVQLERMFEVAEREFGRIDIVCPGAGIYEPVRGMKKQKLCKMLIGEKTNRTGQASGIPLTRPRAGICLEAVDMH